MKNVTPEHLIIVQNPRSTRSEEYSRKVTKPLQEAGVEYDVYHTRYADTEANIAAMRWDLPDNATIISAGGDGTAMQLANAVLRSEKNVKLGFLPLGNFNDIARSYVHKRYTVLDVINAPIIESRPLSIDINGEYWRDAPAYLTMGWTALAASGFGKSESRESMRDALGTFKLIKSLGHLAGDYFRDRNNFLPEFTVNGHASTNTTDILAINNPRVGSIIRSSENFFDTPYFGTRTDIDISKIIPNIPFGLKALSGRAPLEYKNDLHIVFKDSVNVPVQSEGEFEMVNAKEIFIHKDPAKILHILNPTLRY